MNRKPIIIGSGQYNYDIIKLREYPNGFVVGKRNTYVAKTLIEEVGGTCGNVMCILANLGWDARPQVKLIPASYTSFIAFNRATILDAQSMSARKLSSRVLTDHETVTFLKVFSKSSSRNTRSDLVQIIISASAPCNSFSISRVRPKRSSYGL